MIKTLIVNSLKHPLISGSSKILIGSQIGNFLNFIFSTFMSRNLSEVDYGVFVSLVSLITLVAQPAGSVVPTLVNFAANYYAKEELDKVRGLFYTVGKYFLYIGVFIFTFFLVFSNQIGAFFKIESNFLIIIAALTILFTYLGIVNGALLQAKLVFTFIAASNLFSTFLKLLLGILFVFLGYGATGAMVALFIAFSLPYFLSFFPLRFLFRKGIAAPKISLTEMFSYGIPATVALFSLASLISTDIMLVKHFFDPKEAGIYAILSLVARIIYFFSAPIGFVMFPLIIQKHARKEDYQTIFKLSVLLVVLPSIILSVVYFLIPDFILQFFMKSSGSRILASPYLGVFGIFIATYSFLSILTNFYLSINKTKIYIPLAVGALLQVVLIWFFHNSFIEVIGISAIISVVLLIIFLIYYWMLYVKREQ